ncbi:dienelactone hydrolase family protein [Hoeflea poritis]|uniref:Dienelactone hydrolase family protein n=1 Tax=Hoeflea poritis TaxID=2993659 RepID=A0ABT4VJ35_9HYPH|nr:dienelactone hydrolase family protein [Hoeflea poritis]MDA4844728.1 dienelactone hydrolase family protein [Hoeflea poritis]
MRWFGATLLGLFVALGLHGTVAATEVVHFNSAVLDAANRQNNDAVEAGFPIWGHLSRPEGDGPFPAIVLMHGCGGLQQAHFDWASMLDELGYATLVLDSFRPRSVIRVCTSDHRPTSPAQRALDAYGALAFLQQLPDIDQDRIGLIGWSHGGIAALEAVNKKGISRQFTNGFRAAATFYPYCIPDRDFEIPVLILIGESDDWTPPDLCRQLAERDQQSDFLELVTYPGAFHGFDNTDFSTGFFVSGASGGRHWLQYDQAAHRDSAERITDFLARHLGGR